MIRLSIILALLLAALSVAACSGGYSFGASDTGDYRYNQRGASTAPASPEGHSRYIVVLKAGTPDVARTARALAGAYGANPGHVYTHALRGFSVTLPGRAAAAMAGNPQVAYIEPDLRTGAVGKPDRPPGKPPKDPPDEPPSGDEIPWGVDRIDAELNAGAKGAGVSVAVLDTGIDTDHPDLAANYKGGYDFANNDSSPEDDNGHGTHVSGIIAADDNAAGIVGVAPDAGIVAVKVLDSAGSGYLSWLIAGLDWVVQNQSAYGIKVANMSLTAYGTSDALHTAVQAAYSAGVTMSAAAGNDRMDAYYFIPASYDEVICVTALEPNNRFARYSNCGSLVDLIAPGSSVKSTWPGGGFAILSGTSMAAPHVAGAAALYLDDHTGTPAQVMQALINAGELPRRGKWRGDPDGIGEPLVDAETL